MPDDGFVVINGICKEDKCFEMAIFSPEVNWIVAMQIFNEDGNGRDFVNQGIYG